MLVNDSLGPLNPAHFLKRKRGTWVTRNSVLQSVTKHIQIRADISSPKIRVMVTHILDNICQSIPHVKRDNYGGFIAMLYRSHGFRIKGLRVRVWVNSHVV